MPFFYPWKRKSFSFKKQELTFCDKYWDIKLIDLLLKMLIFIANLLKNVKDMKEYTKQVFSLL